MLPYIAVFAGIFVIAFIGFVILALLFADYSLRDSLIVGAVAAPCIVIFVLAVASINWGMNELNRKNPVAIELPEKKTHAN